MKSSKIILKTLIGTVLLFQMNLSAQAVHIPETTLKIAREAHIKEAAFKNKPSSQVIRVGIGDSGFKSYVYETATIYGTSLIYVYNDNALIQELPANAGLVIKFTPDGQFNLSMEDGSILATVQGPVRITSPNGLLGIKGLKRAGTNALYHGAFEIVKANAGSFNVVNMIEVEDYLKGVVPNEMPVRFGLEALKAQSVAARNYVLSPRVKASKNYDVVDSVASQVYFGANTEKELANQAVKETEGVVALYDWNLILAQYSSTAGGYTESYSNAFSDPKTKAFPSEGKPFLTAKPDIIGQTPLNSEDAAYKFYSTKPDSYDIRSPYYRWQKEWNVKELHDVIEKNLPSQSAAGFVQPAFNKGEKLGELQNLKVKRRGESGKIMELEIITSSGNYKISKELMIRRLLTKDGKALPSANVVFELTNDESGKLSNIKAYGGGFGHGVGMSQFGAGFMGGELHLPYTKILQHYYSGITLGTKPFTLSKTEGQNVITQHFYTDKKHAKILIDNKNGASKFIVNLNGKEHVCELPTGIMSGKRFVETDVSKYINKGRNDITFYYPENEKENRAIKIYVELVEKDDNNGIW